MLWKKLVWRLYITWSLHFTNIRASSEFVILVCPSASVLIKVSLGRHQLLYPIEKTQELWAKYRTAEEKSFCLNTSLRRRPIIGTDYFHDVRRYYGNEIEVTTIETVSVDFERRTHWTNKLSSSRSHEERFFAGQSPFTSLRSLFLSAFVTS